MNVLLVLMIGLLTGWVAQQRVKRHEFSLTSYLAIGVWGAVIGSLLFDLLGLYSYSLMGSLMIATIGLTVVKSLVNWIEIG